MKNKLFSVVLLVVAFIGFQSLIHASVEETDDSLCAEYTLIVTGFDWGAAANKVILNVGTDVSEVTSGNYRVTVQRTSDEYDISPEKTTGKLDVLSAYISDENGGRVNSGEYVTLVLSAGPDHVMGQPFEYLESRNRWVNYALTITDTSAGRSWDTESNRILPIVDEFDLTGGYQHENGHSLTYAAFEPETESPKSPLIIWLHGGGEGGTDVTIPLLANRATRYASEEIQAIFDDAYVLVPQTPTFWMENADGEYTVGQVDDIQHGALMGLIQHYVDTHPKIDADRVYIGGASNGGYMSLKLILEHPDYFAAGYISALAYFSEYISDEQIDRIKHMPIWFVHAADDGTTVPSKTVIPVYERLIAAGAEDVHLSFYDHVVDLSGLFGGKDYRYNGHYSWIYSHANVCRFDYDGSPVRVEGRPVTIMEWLATQRR